MDIQTHYGNQDWDHLSPIQKLLHQHRKQLYEKVKEMRAFSYGERKYPRRQYNNERFHPGDNMAGFIKKYNDMVKHGGLVKTKVEWLVPYQEYEKDRAYRTREQMTEEERKYYLWPGEAGKEIPIESDWHRSSGKYPGSAIPENPLLAITVEPTFKTEFPVRHYRYTGEPFHVSLAKYWELGPDIYDPGNIMEDLIRTFHNKTVKLKFDPNHLGDRYFHIPKKPEEGPPEWRMAEATVFSLNPMTDPIATNPAARWAKAQGYMADRDWHFSL
jgi:hypothetical protein